MQKAQIEELKDSVVCPLLLEQAGFALDLRESTRNAQKYRRDTKIIIVIHEGRGWFDPLSENKGDIVDLASYLGAASFQAALLEIAALVGKTAAGALWHTTPRDPSPATSIADRWQAKPRPSYTSAAWRYLAEFRHLPDAVIRAAVDVDILREGPRGSMWAGHFDAERNVTGWEERGPHWRGFAKGGAKRLFCLGPRDAIRLCVTEAAIDAMSLAAIEGMRADTAYLSTGGGWSDAATEALHLLAKRDGISLVAATDNNRQGDLYASRLLEIAEVGGCHAERLRPRCEDWNAQLQAGGREGMKKEDRSQSDRTAVANAQSPPLAIPARRLSQG